MTFHKRLPWGRGSIWAIGLFGFALLLRFLAAWLPYPLSNSEEGTMGIMALHIAYQGKFPNYFYGQSYMGTTEAYLSAFFFRLFGASLFSIRLAMLLLFALALWGIYRLAFALYGRRTALWSLAVLSIGSLTMITPEIRAVGGAVETLISGSFCFLLALWIARSRREHSKLWQRLLAYFAWGLMAGWGLWSHLLVLPFIATSFLLLLSYWRAFWRGGILFLFMGLCIGSMGSIFYNLQATPGQNSLAVFFQIQQSTFGHPQPDVGGWKLLMKKLVGTLGYTFPMALGAPRLGEESLISLPYFGKQSAIAPLYWLVQGGWTFTLLSLAACATLLPGRQIYRSWKRHRQGKAGWKPEEEEQATLSYARFLLALNVWVTILGYLSSISAAQRPDSTRYFVGMLLLIPTMIWPLVRFWQAGIFQRMGIILISGLILLGLGSGTVQGVLQIPEQQLQLRQEQQVIAKLREYQINYVYSGYWICDSLIFATQEQIICAYTTEGGYDVSARYGNYVQQVEQHKADAAYVFTDDNGEFPGIPLRQRLEESGKYQRIELAGYLIYLPKKAPSAL